MGTEAAGREEESEKEEAVGRRRRRWLKGGGRRQMPSDVHGVGAEGGGQGLTLVHFSAQLEPSLKQENTLHTPNTP